MVCVGRMRWQSCGTTVSSSPEALARCGQWRFQLEWMNGVCWANGLCWANGVCLATEDRQMELRHDSRQHPRSPRHPACTATGSSPRPESPARENQQANLCCGVTSGAQRSAGRHDATQTKLAHPNPRRAAAPHAAHLCCGVTVSSTSEGVMMSLTLVLLDCLPLTTTLLR